MTPGNIAIVLGPNLLWMNNEGCGFSSPSAEFGFNCGATLKDLILGPSV